MNPPRRSFQTTQWSLVRRALIESPDQANSALADLCDAYWYPIYIFIRRRGYPVQDAEDLTQGFFVRLLEKNILAGADQDKGRLRTFLLTCLRRYLADENDRRFAQKRGATVTFSLDFAGAEDRYQGEPASPELTPDRIFQRRWAVTLLEHALDSIEASFHAEGRDGLFAAIRPFLGCGRSATESYATAAARLGMPEGTLKSHVSRLRERWREVLFQQVSMTLDDPTSENIRAELSELQDWL